MAKSSKVEQSGAKWAKVTADDLVQRIWDRVKDPDGKCSASATALNLGPQFFLSNASGQSASERWRRVTPNAKQARPPKWPDPEQEL